MALDVQAATAALRKVMDPELHRDVVSLGMVKDLAVRGDAVSLTMELTTPACPLKDRIGKDVEAALRAAGAARVEIAWSSQVRAAPGMGQGGRRAGEAGQDLLDAVGVGDRAGILFVMQDEQGDLDPLEPLPRHGVGQCGGGDAGDQDDAGKVLAAVRCGGRCRGDVGCPCSCRPARPAGTLPPAGAG